MTKGEIIMAVVLPVVGAAFIGGIVYAFVKMKPR